MAVSGSFGGAFDFDNEFDSLEVPSNMSLFRRKS